MTLRCIFTLLAFLFFVNVQADRYRIFFKDKGNHIASQVAYEDQPVYQPYIDSVTTSCDSVILQSAWLNYMLVEHHEFPWFLERFSFIEKIVKVENEMAFILEADSIYDKVLIDDNESYLRWQLDTMGYQFFKQKNITGRGVIIAVLDAGFTGVDESPYFKHLFKNGQIIATKDLIDGDDSVYHGASHGCMVLSCMAGQFEENPLGLATGANYILIRTEELNRETKDDEDRWVQGIELAYKMGADVVNSSLGFTVPMHQKSDLNGQSFISQAAKIAADKGMIVISSAGNEYASLWKSISIPADAENIISVGGYDREGIRAYFSSVGPTADGRMKPELSAPGFCLMAQGNNLVIRGGTSFAAPLVTGYVACMIQLKGKKNISRQSLIETGSVYPYYDYIYGYGSPNPETKVITIDSSGVINDIIIQVDKTKRTVTINASILKSNRIFYKIQDRSGRIKFYDVKRVKKKKITLKIPYTNQPPVEIQDQTKYYSADPTDKWIFYIDGNIYQY
jgi:serine protease AprX